MKRARTYSSLALVSLATAVFAGIATAAPSAPSVSAANPSAASSAPSAAPSGSASARKIQDGDPLPPGHPSLEPQGGGEEAMPPDHPGSAPNEDDVPIGPDGKPIKRLPDDDSQEDGRLAAGTIRLQVRDADDRPVAHRAVTLAITRNSIAEDSVKTKKQAETDADGFVEWSGLGNGSLWTYRLTTQVSDPADPSATATYGLPPINLPLDKGWRALLHVFPVTADIERVAAGVDGVDTIVEVRDDVIEVTQIFELADYSPVAWSFGKGLVLALPKGAKALRGQDSMQDFRVSTEELGGGLIGAKWLGSVSPGKMQISYDFKLPYASEPSVEFELPLPPHTVAARVRTPARKEMSLTVDGFPAAKEDNATSGVRVLSTIKAAKSFADLLHTLHVRIDGLPTPGPERKIAASICALLVAIGIGLRFMLDDDAGERAALARAKERRKRELLDELKALAEAHRRGEVGPKAFERERAALIESLADVVG